MDIKAFIFTLLGISIISYFIPVKNIKKNSDNSDIPLVIFEKPLMYTLNENNISRIVNSTKAVRYKTRDEMFDADITLKNQDSNKKFEFENLKADIIIKKAESYTLIDNVKYTRDNFVTLNTNQMFYDNKKRIAHNNKPFEGTYYSHYIKGTDLYLNANDNFIKAKKTHFEIDINKK